MPDTNGQQARQAISTRARRSAHRATRPLPTQYEREAYSFEGFPAPGELLYDIGMLLAGMLGVALVAILSLGGFLSG